MDQNQIIRPATSIEAQHISDLAFRSKAYWGYSAEFMAACRAELTFDADYIATHPTYIIKAEGKVVGFYKLEQLTDDEGELGALFVEPEAVGQGYGRALMIHAKQQASDLGYRTMLIQGDPNAERFYRAAGGKLIGTKESSSIPGRQLPLLQIELKDLTEA